MSANANLEDRISLNSIIGSFVGNTGVENVNSIITDLARWACEAELKIGSEDTYVHHECEIKVENRRACLPRNFVRLKAIKVGDRFMDVTKKDFRQFSKGNRLRIENQNGQEKFIGGNLQVSVPGQIQSIKVKFFGAYVAGEMVNLTITYNDCGNTSFNTYIYVVEPNDTLNDIAVALANQINAIGNLPFTANAVGTEIDFQGKDATVLFNISEYTNSITGSLEVCLIQQRRLPRTIENNQLTTGPKTPRLQSENLANSRTYNLNTGNLAQDGQSAGTYGYNYDLQPLTSVFSIDNGWINFNTAVDGKVGISYWGIAIDHVGFPLIRRAHEDAVAHYLEYMWTKRRYLRGKVPEHVYQNTMKRWFDLCGQARGDDELPDQTEYRYLANVWNQLIPLPHKNFF